MTDAFFLDDNRIVTASLDTSARIRSLRVNEEDVETPLFDEHLSGITATDISAAGRILTGCGRGDLYLWSAGADEPGLLKSHDVGIRHVDISPTGDEAVSVDEAGGCRLWSLSDQSAKDISEEVGIAAVSAAFNSSGNVLIFAGRGGEVAFHDLSGNTLIGSRTGHRGACTRIVPQPDSSRAASLGEDGQVVLWESTSGEVVQRIQLPEDARGVRDAAFHDDGELLLTVDDAGYLRVWDTRHGRLRQEFRAHPVVANALIAHPDGRHVVTAGIDGTLRVWQIQQHFETTVLPGDDGATWGEFSPDGKLYVTSHESGVARIYETSTHQLSREFVHSADDWVKQAQFSPGDGSRLLTIGGRTARLFDTATGELVWSLPEIHEELVVSAAQFVGQNDAFVLAFRRQGTVSGFNEDEGWYYWDLSENQVEAIRHGQVGRIRKLQFSPDQRVLVALHAPGNGSIWRFDSGDRNGGWDGATCAVFPSPGQLTWGVQDGTLRLTRYDTGWELSRSNEAGASAICAIAALDNGNYVVVGTNDGRISIRDRVSCSLVRHMKPLSNDSDRYITSLAVSQDSSLIATGTAGGKVGLWEPESGELVGQWFADDVISAVTFSPRSSSLLFTSRDGSVRHVRIPPFANTHDEVAARVWRLTQFEEVAGDRQYQEAVASLEQTINAATGQTEKLAGFQHRDLRTLRETIHRNVASYQSDVAVENIHQILSRPDVAPSEVFSLRFLLARMQEKYSGLSHALQAHDSAVHEIRISPDGSSFLTVSADRTARLWSLPDLRPLHTLSHDSIVWDGQFSPDGNLVAIIGFDRNVHLWNARTGELEHVLTSHRNRIGDLGFSPDGNRLITGSRDQTAILWDVPARQPISTLEGHSDYVLYAQIDPTGKFAVTASRSDAWPRVWDVETGRLVSEIKLTESADAELRANDVCFSKSGNLFGFPCSDGTVHLWNPETEQAIRLNGHEGPVYNAVLSSDGKVCVTASGDGTARVWDLKEEGPVERHVLHHSARDSVDRLRCPPDHSRAVTACGRMVRVWNIKSGEPLAEFAGHEESPVEAAVTADGNTVITASQSGKIRTWSVTNARPSTPSRLSRRIAHSWPMRDDTLLIADESGKLELVNSQSAQSLSTATSQHVGLAGFAWFAADRETGLYAATTPEGQLITGTCTDGAIEEPRLISGDNQFIGKVAVSTDWSQLAAQVNEHTLAVWNPGTDDEPTVWDSVHDNITALAFSSDGSLLASAGNNIVRLWKVEDHSLIAELRGHMQPIEAVSVSDDGKRIITGSRDHSARIWSVENESVEHLLYGHTAAVNHIVRNETGGLVLTLSIDGQAIIWNCETGHRVCELRSDSEAILQAEFLHDPALVVTTTSSGAVRVWDTANGRVIYSYAERGPSTSTCHVLENQTAGTKSILAVSKNGFVQQWSAEIEKRSMDNDSLVRAIRRIAGRKSETE